MKNLFLLLLTCTLSISANSQIVYQEVDSIIDLSKNMNCGVTDFIEFDFDQDGSNDMRITSWSNHYSCGIETVVEILMLGANGHVKDHNFSSYAPNCPSSAQFGNAIGGYLFTSDESNPYDNSYVKIPFDYNTNTNTSYGMLYVRYEGEIVTIEGYAWNQTPGQPCDCNSTGMLGSSELTQPQKTGNFKYYNLMGQELENPSGVVLKVYDSGLTERVYISN